VFSELLGRDESGGRHALLYTFFNAFDERFSLNSAAFIRILHSFTGPDFSMTNALIVLALASVGAYLIRRALRHTPTGRGIDVGSLSTAWIAEQRREEPR
jgi:hypothetical protein